LRGVRAVSALKSGKHAPASPSVDDEDAGVSIGAISIN